jgi:ABC-type uncharacterized transport system substrate-binding protein
LSSSKPRHGPSPKLLHWLNRRVAVFTLAAALSLSAGGLPSEAASPEHVLVVLSHPHVAYAEVVAGMRAALAGKPGAPSLAVSTPEEFHESGSQAAGAPRAALIVTVGARAAREVAAARPAVPVLQTLLPRLAFEEIAASAAGAETPRRLSAIYLDQPYARQFELIRTALPHVRRVAVLLGPASQVQEREILGAAREKGLDVAVAKVLEASDLFRVLGGVLDGVDALLAVADPLVYNDRTIHHLLLTTYHYKVPVIGLSRAYVEAGAVIALYSTPEQIGRQAAEMLLEPLAGSPAALPPPRHPKYFTVSVNERVAASLGLRLPREEDILRRLATRTPSAP